MILDQKKIGDAIRLFRKARGMTQAELAKAVNMASNSIAVLERGERGFTTHTLNSLAQALNVPTLWLTVLGTPSPIKVDPAAAKVLENIQDIVRWTVTARPPKRRQPVAKKLPTRRKPATRV